MTAKEAAMKCPVCKHGGAQPGEDFHSAEVTEALLRQAEAAVGAGVEVDVRRFAGR